MTTASLPPSRHAVAWTASAALHALALALLLWVLHPGERPPAHREDRLVYVEPAPPPPPPGGPAAGASTEPVEAPKPAPTPRLTLPAKPDKPKPVAKPKPVPAPKPAPPHETGGESGGVAGGTPGGKVGGTVGGHGDAPITAELAASPPAIVSRAMPEYPYAARAAQVEGQVLLRAVVDREGHIEPAVTVLRSVPMLDAAAIAALRQWRFTPGRDHEGNTVRVVIEVPMRFQLR